ncbi:MarR family winged helix-turn-helix transcriptional regulator [Nonomuraea gerenzanensis]|uniref:MarR-family transcriptional regulator n=1 Tax=Nonomuraea gerenzanensis TaxID=93944 RepID=A0A1M4EKK3_9ACTN|nr:MarR family transcriptional regulator [Nonomuraea gerenzanensis]UBU10844.1 MarR family transcriptional regulator [Nonomuraea gerenzanensis]SBO99278.1 MarR-family transcriptional regulator [Nonomuraea gerenzanensis]
MAEKELAELLFLVGKRLRHGYSHQLVPLGLNPGQARALRALADAGRPLRMVALADELRIVPRSLTPVVDALEEAGLVRREVDPANRRSTLLVITPEGRELAERARDARRQAGEDLFAVLSEEQREQLRELLVLVDAQFR